MSNLRRPRGRLASVAPILGALALLALAAPRPVHACSCLWIPTLDVERTNSAAIFTGFPINVRSAEPEYPYSVWVTFRVGAVWKGTVTPTIEVLTGANEGICGVTFRTGIEYLVFAYGHGSGSSFLLTAGLCGRTAPALENPDVIALGPPIAVPVSPRSWGKLKVLFRG
ncbi:MAG: hypothetical protein ACREOU_05170 [Candidatus Eiseniibacteriota bacterium]